jgi:hypothetical protein
MLNVSGGGMWLFCRVMVFGPRESFLPVVFFGYIYIFLGVL